ncbi:acyl carrier protein [Urbifossiella limnaea]|uniref:Acyl carrier protein n=1 Tax=Urbifossiella limnaea TaxID=2528023 RepID=A0A517Y371_9BACT|nr:acyl carrier protein [Urbifossiella limnaea]QDU24189.1 acyl carrier protein [Urbifossiella limnaea]
MLTQEKTTTIEQRVRAFVADNYQFGGTAATLADTESFLGAGLIDSMGVLELVTFVEDTFGVRVADDEVVPANLDSIAGVAALVRRKLPADEGARRAG